MKKITLSIILWILVLTLTSCGSAAPTSAVEGVSSTPIPGTGNPTPGFPLSLQLALGTLKLEGSPQAVTAEQAAELLPLWKAASSLSGSDNITAEEVNAIFEQIQATMTAEQLDAIEEMALSGEDMAALAQELGIELGGAGRFGELTPELQATAQAAQQSGQFPPSGEFGGQPGGGFQGRASGGEFDNLTPEQRATAVAGRSEAGGGVRAGVNVSIYNAVIELLEGKITAQ